MKFSMCTAVYGMHDLHDTINRAATIGFDAVELTAALHLPINSSSERRREVKGWIRDAGLECSALHYIFDGSVKLATADRELNAKCTEYLCKVIDVAADVVEPIVMKLQSAWLRSSAKPESMPLPRMFIWQLKRLIAMRLIF